MWTMDVECWQDRRVLMRARHVVLRRREVSPSPANRRSTAGSVRRRRRRRSTVNCRCISALYRPTSLTRDMQALSRSTPDSVSTTTHVTPLSLFSDMHSADYAVAKCLSVCLSVTRRTPAFYRNREIYQMFLPLCSPVPHYSSFPNPNRMGIPQRGR